MFKKKKNEKAENMEAGSKGKKKGKKEKKKVDLIDRVIFVGFSLVIVVFMIVALFAMDVFHVKSNLVDKITKDLVAQQESSIDQYISRDKIDGYREIISNEFTNLSMKEAELVDFKKTLDEKDKNLELSLAEYETRKVELESMDKEIRGAYEDIQEVCKVVEKMDAKNAALMLSNIEDLDLVKNIIFQVSEEQAAEILENLNPEVAAKITMDRFNSGTQ
jgi:flagellar motility protein MotE (MotC chaperone)